MTINTHLSVDRQMTGDIYTSSEIMDNLAILCDEFGSRFGGTEGERLAAEFMRDKMGAYGLQNVRLEPLKFLAWKRAEASLEVLSPVHRTIPCISLPHAPAGTVEADLIDMGDGSPEAFNQRALELRGQVAMTNSVVSPVGSKRWIHRNDKLGYSLLAGAEAFIFVNHYPGFGPATGGIGHGGGLAKIPGISVSYEDGAALSRLVEKVGRVRIRIKTQDEAFEATSWNVVGEIPGRSKQQIMLGCHYDGHDISQGAQDPASGAVAVLEAARVLAKYADKPAFTLRFALWGVEEIGLLGSKAYVKEHADELDKIRFYLNMDSAGAIPKKGIVVNEWPKLVPVFEAWAKEMSLPFKVGQSIHAFSDHFPFLMAGVPTGGIESVVKDLSGRGYGHTAYDTLDKANIRSLREAADLAARVGLRMANEKEWPAHRRSDKAVAKLFQAPEYQEAKADRDRIAAFYGRED
jgi:Zn-dependent M28 family amino/carboxypeptidase